MIIQEEVCDECQGTGEVEKEDYPIVCPHCNGKSSKDEMIKFYQSGLEEWRKMASSLLSERDELKKEIQELRDGAALALRARDRSQSENAELKKEVERLKGWTDCKEKMPEPNVRVLVSILYPNMGTRQTDMSFTTTKFPDLFDHVYSDIITHWKPIPEFIESLLKK